MRANKRPHTAERKARSRHTAQNPAADVRPIGCVPHALPTEYGRRYALEVDFMCVNFDTANVDLLFDDESSLVIDCNAVENQYGTTMRRRCELDWLIYNEPLSYAQMLLDGSMETYLANVAK